MELNQTIIARSIQITTSVLTLCVFAVLATMLALILNKQIFISQYL